MTAPADLDYAPHETDAAESAAVWRVAWWAGLLWAGLFCVVWMPLAWDAAAGRLWDVAGGLTARIAVWRTAQVICVMCCVALVTALLTRRPRWVVAWIGTAALACQAVGWAVSLTFQLQTLGLARASSMILLDAAHTAGGLLLVMFTACGVLRPDVRALKLSVATLLLVAPTRHGIYLGETGLFFGGFGPADQILTTPGALVEHAVAATMLGAAVILFADWRSGRLTRARAVLVASLVLAARCGGRLAQSQLGHWADLESSAWSQVVGLAEEAMYAAPALALLAWRPPGRDTTPRHG